MQVSGILLILCMAAAPPQSAGEGSTSAAAGFVLPSGAIESPELTAKLESLRTVRWIAAVVYDVEAPLSAVVAHLRGEQNKQEAAGAGPLRGRLKDWLEKNPEEMRKYREFQRAQGPDPGTGDWETRTIPASEIPLLLGGGESYRQARFSGRRVEMAFGRILLPDSIVRVQLVSPHPSPDGRALVSGTSLVLIREGREPTGSAPAAPETVDGPESRGLASRLTGWLVMDQPVGGMVAVGVPGLDRRTVRDPAGPEGVVHALSGPDSDGRIAYIENHAGEGRHSLKTIRVDGTGNEVVISRPGEAFLEMAVGGSLALSPTRGRVALLGRLSRFQTHRPSFPLRIGRVEIWDLARKSGRAVDILALDRRLSWFPDARRLAYVELVPASKAVFPQDAAADKFGDSFRAWEAVPVVRILDTETEGRTSLHVGWDPVVSTDGRSVLVRDGDNRWRQVDVESGYSHSVKWPGDAGGAIALTGEGLVVYWGLPTTGAAPDFTRTYNPAFGPRPMKSIKVADLSSQRFETLLPSLDPRRDLSFGFAPLR
jgi:hypothetical protein